MTREEIESIYVLVPNCFDTDREEDWYKVGLKDGLSSADEHPKSPWIKFRDIRPDIMCLVLVYHDEEAFTAYFKEFDDGLYWRSDVGLVPVLDDDYWMLIPKLEEE